MSEKIFVLEIGRPIYDDVVKQFGEEAIVGRISELRKIDNAEFSAIAAQLYKGLRETGATSCVFSGPVPLAFIAGQLVGIDHLPVKELLVYNPASQNYAAVPAATRELIC